MTSEASNPPSEVPPTATSGQPLNRPLDGVAVPPEAVEAMRKIGEQKPNAAFGISMALGAPINPIHQKVTESHITLVLETAKQTSIKELELKERQQEIGWKESVSDRIFEIVMLIAFVAIIVFVIDKFQNQPTILVPILTGVGGLFTGFLAGIGYGKKGK